MTILRRLIAICIALIIVSVVAFAQQQQQADQADPADPVVQAIAKCRLRLEDLPSDVPHAFPKTQYRLALLLESRLPSSANEAEDGGMGMTEWANSAREIANLYEASAFNATHGFPPSIRVEALTRAASLTLEVGDMSRSRTGGVGTDSTSSMSVDSKKIAQDMLYAALDITGEDVDEQDPLLLQTAHAAAFEKLVKLLLARASSEVAHLSGNKSSKGKAADDRKYLEMALGLCNTCAQLSPKEPVCDEYHGAVLRRLHRTRGLGAGFAKSSILNSGASNEPQQPPLSATKDVHDAYKQAAKKSHEAAVVAVLTDEARGISRYPCGTLRFKYGKKVPPSNQIRQPAENDVAHLSELWTRLVRHIVLAAAAAREAGLREEEDKHISYGLAIVSHLTLSALVSTDVQADLLTNAGIRHKVRGETKEAARYFQAAVESNPGDGHAMVQLASLGDRDAASVTALSDSYVAGLFDGYSDRFEKELVEDLRYRGHEIVADAILRHWGGSNDGAGDVVILDIGCGTGLLGSLLRERIGAILAGSGDATCKSSVMTQKVSIRGVDLSRRMVEISRARTQSDTSGNEIPVYDDVQSVDASAFLRSMGTGSIGIITASDVFIYIGALDDVFKECSRVLKRGGLVGFTVEIPPDGGSGKGLMLLKSGRFGHSKTYIQEIANNVGLAIVEWKEEVLRKQGKDDVKGAVVTLRLQ